MKAKRSNVECIGKIRHRVVVAIQQLLEWVAMMTVVNARAPEHELVTDASGSWDVEQ